MIDLNHGSGYQPCPVDGRPARINANIDAALVAENRLQPRRSYLGASRVGEPCSRKLVYEYTRTPKDEGRDFGGGTLRIFAAGHQFEALTARWLRAAGFDLRTHDRAGGQFGFSVAGGRIRGHIDGAIVGGPDVGISWPALWEHKALNDKSWTDLARRGLRVSKPIYWAQVHLYMAYMQLRDALFMALNKNSQALYHEIVPLDTGEAQAFSDRAVEIVRAAEAGELMPRIAGSPDFYLCHWCEYARRCWEIDR